MAALVDRALGSRPGRVSMRVGQLEVVTEYLVELGLPIGRLALEPSHEPLVQPGAILAVVYRSTKAGRLELERWLAEPSVRRAGYRDDFFLKLFVASRSDANRVRDVVRVQSEALLAELSVLTGLKRKHRDEPLVALLIEAATLHTSANLKVADLAGSRAEEIAANAGPLSHEVRTHGQVSAGQS